jgi:predicted dehydrogenase
LKSLLIGFGSIGRRHLRELSSRSREVIIYDFKNSFPEIIQEVGNATFYSDWNTLTNDHKSIDLAVISTWGPNHLTQLRNVTGLGVKSVLIEKPLASSLQDLKEIESIVEENGLRIFENFHFRYSNFKNAIQQLEREFNLGNFIQFNISGGAKCIATTGIHYLDLCEWLLDCRPVNVISDVNYAYINPRSSALRIYGGLVKWAYPNGSMLTMNFTNDSYSDEVIELVWKNAKAVFDGNALTLFGPVDFPTYDQLTTARVKPFTRQLINLDAMIGVTNNDGMTNLYNAFFNPNERYRNLNPGSSTKDLISALIASKLNTKLSLDSDPIDFMQTDWEIS